MTISSLSERFNARAARYDNRLTALIGERELRQIRSLVPRRSQVLDYGCGTGRTTLDLLKRGCAVTAFDISEQMLSIARTKASQTRFIAEFTADSADLAGKTWPVVTCIGVLDYYPDPIPLLQTLKGYLAPGGRLVLTIPNALSPLAWIYAFGSRLTVPATPRTPAFLQGAARRAGLKVRHQNFAFPAWRPVGHTIILELTFVGQPYEGVQAKLA